MLRSRTDRAQRISSPDFQPRNWPQNPDCNPVEIETAGLVVLVRPVQNLDQGANPESAARAGSKRIHEPLLRHDALVSREPVRGVPEPVITLFGRGCAVSVS